MVPLALLGRHDFFHSLQVIEGLVREIVLLFEHFRLVDTERLQSALVRPLVALFARERMHVDGAFFAPCHDRPILRQISVVKTKRQKKRGANILAKQEWAELHLAVVFDRRETSSD